MGVNLSKLESEAEELKGLLEQRKGLLDQQQEKITALADTEMKTDIIKSIGGCLTTFVDAFKKHLAMLIIFVLLGVAGGLYIGKIIYNMRMGEICMVGGYVYDNKIYDVKLRP